VIHSGIFVVISFIQLGIIAFLYMSLRSQKQETKDEYLARRRAELRVDLTAVASLDKPVGPV
jgi:hypothetical protein